MRPKVHLLGFRVWMEARWFLDRSLIPMWSVRVYFGRGELETESFEVFSNQSDKASVRNTYFAPAFLRKKKKRRFAIVDMQQTDSSVQTVLGRPLWF